VDAKRRAAILDRYGARLENNPYSVGRLRDLPFGKTLIRHALLEELLNNDDPQLQSHLETAIMSLEAFVSDEEFELVSKHEAAMKETSKKMENEGARAILSASEADTWEPYVEILERVHAEQAETMSCVRRLFPSPDAVDRE
jgi:hypothetical protein